jgi:hypothetical protein
MSKHDKLRQATGRRQSNTRDESQVDAAELLNLAEEAFDTGDNITIRNRHAQNELEHAIVRVDDNRWRFRNFEMTLTQLVIPSVIDEEETDALGNILAGMDSAIQFWIGDWTNIYVGDEDIDQERGKTYAYLSEKFGITHRTLKNYASVCRIISVSLRRDTVSFTIHREVAELPEQLKGYEEYFLDWAEKTNATKRELQAHIAEKKREISGKAATRILPTQDSFLFDKTRKPQINSFQKLWSKAQNGDQKALEKTRQEIEKHRKWLDEVEDSLS